MDPDLVLQKTAKGREEIEKRTNRLDSRRRTMLILVDGRSSAGDLAGKAGHIQEPLALLDSLLGEGYVHAGNGAPQAAGSDPVPAAATAAGGSAPTGQALDLLKRRASKEIERLMGPGGEGVALKLERAATYQDFLVEAHKTRDALQSFLGARKAEEFWNSLQI